MNITSRAVNYRNQQFLKAFTGEDREFSQTEVDTATRLWEETTGEDIEDFRGRVNSRARLSRHNPNMYRDCLGAHVFTGFTSEFVAFATSLFIPYSEFLEFHKDTYTCLSLSEMKDVLKIKNEIYEMECQIEELSKPVGWFKSLFTDNAKEVEELKGRISESKDLIAKLDKGNEVYTEFLKNLESPFLQKREEMKISFYSQKSFCTLGGENLLQTTEEREEEDRIRSLAVEQIKVEAMVERLKSEI